MKILFICCAGMSSSMLVEKLKNYLKDFNDEKSSSIEIEAIPLDKVNFSKIDCDLILLAPQIGYKLREFKLRVASKFNIPIKIIPGRDYGLFNVENIVNLCINSINIKLQENRQQNLLAY